MPRAIWKDRAAYLDVIVDGEANPAPGWICPVPEGATGDVAGHVAFWPGVTVEP